MIRGSKFSGWTRQSRNTASTISTTTAITLDPMYRSEISTPDAMPRRFYEGMEAEGQQNINKSAALCLEQVRRNMGPLVWSGDIHSSFESLRNQFAAGAQYGHSRYSLVDNRYRRLPRWKPLRPRVREVLVRWFEYGAFCPVMRLHGDRNPIRRP